MKAFELNLRCKHCDRFLKLKVKKSSNVIVTCTDRKCKKDTEVEVVMMTDLMKQDNEYVKH